LIHYSSCFDLLFEGKGGADNVVGLPRQHPGARVGRHITKRGDRLLFRSCTGGEPWGEKKNGVEQDVVLSPETPVEEEKENRRTCQGKREKCSANSGSFYSWSTTTARKKGRACSSRRVKKKEKKRRRGV